MGEYIVNEYYMIFYKDILELDWVLILKLKIKIVLVSYFVFYVRNK